jgi:xanthine dehydrogenase YagS FAD-binding subunit
MTAMNRFSWYEAKNVEEALSQVNATLSQTLQSETPGNAAVFKSGGIDLLDLMKEGLCAPKTIVNIKNIAGLDMIAFDRKKGLRIGANATLSQIADDPFIQAHYPALHQAAGKAGTPQLRNTASIGGNLAQRTRCWYFRSADHPCLRKGGSICFARHGENEHHAILENDSCVSVHASSVATALMAFGAGVEITGIRGRKKVVPLESFFVLPETDLTRETVLGPKELITAVVLPPVTSGTRSFYINQGAKRSHDWPLADVAVVMEFSGSVCSRAVIALGAAAPVPLKSDAAAQVLIGKAVTEEIAGAAAEAAMEGASPLEKNGYKVPLFKTVIKRAIMKALTV